MSDWSLVGEKFRCPYCKRMIKLNARERLSYHGVRWPGSCPGSLTIPVR